MYYLYVLFRVFWVIIIIYAFYFIKQIIFYLNYLKSNNVFEIVSFNFYGEISALI